MGVARPPRHVGGDLATPLPLGDGLFEEVALVVRNFETSDCRPTHVVVCHRFNADRRLLIGGVCTQYERAFPSPLSLWLLLEEGDSVLLHQVKRRPATGAG